MTESQDSSAKAIRDLIAKAGHYLRSFSGPGIIEVHAGLDRWQSGSLSPVASRHNPVVSAHLANAIGNIEHQPALASSIAAAAPHLPWVTYDLYDPAAIGEAFATSHAFAPIISEAGPMLAQDFELGLFLIAPKIFYRDHNHAAPELYAPLTGPHGWRFAPGDSLQWKPAHEPVWNEPFRPHATKAGAVPFLCFYVWTANVNEPATVLPASDWAAIEQ